MSVSVSVPVSFLLCACLSPLSIRFRPLSFQGHRDYRTRSVQTAHLDILPIPQVRPFSIDQTLKIGVENVDALILQEKNRWNIKAVVNFFE